MKRAFGEADLARVTAPVGLDIGSQTVPEIAISIVAELIARRNLGDAGAASGPHVGEAPDRVDAAVPCDSRRGGCSMIAAIVPAAGRSKRMGQPKLLLPIDGETLIARVVTALREGGAERVVVVAPPADSDEGPAVARAGRAGRGFRALRRQSGRPRCVIRSKLAWRPLAKPTPPDHVLLAPGDVRRHQRPDRRRGSSKKAPASRRRSSCPAAATPRAPGRAAVEDRCGRRVTPDGAGVNALLARHQSLRGRACRSPTRALRTTSTRPEDLSSVARCNGRAPAAFVQVQILRAGEGACRAAPRWTSSWRAASASADLRAEIARRMPELAPLMKNVMIAVNEEYADDEAPIKPAHGLR